MKIGARIRAQREARRLTQRQMAAGAGLSRMHVIRIERDEISPTLDTVERIAVALGVSVRRLIPKSVGAQTARRPGQQPGRVPHKTKGERLTMKKVSPRRMTAKPPGGTA